MKNIVNMWIESQKEQHGLNQVQALNQLNQALHSNHAPHRLTEWKKERRTLPLRVANYMLQDAVEYSTRHQMPVGVLRLPVPSA